MQFIITKTQTTLTALTQQVFEVHGGKATASAKQVQAALRAANPHWGEAAKLPAGTLVVVPDVPGVNATAAQSMEVVSPTVVAQLQQVLADAQVVLQQSVTSATREIETSVALAKNRELGSLAKQTAELSPLLTQITGQSKLQLKQIQTANAAQLQGLAQLGKDLGALN